MRARVMAELRIARDGLSQECHMRLRPVLVIVFLFCAATGGSGAQDQTDPYAAAMQAYRAKDYAAYLENIRRAGQQLPYNVEILELVARAYALNGHPGEALAILRNIARMGGAANLEHADLAGLKGRPELGRLRAAFRRNDSRTRRRRVAFTHPQKD
jgi:thioredoxin-like negative regulator of GroEL